MNVDKRNSANVILAKGQLSNMECLQKGNSAKDKFSKGKFSKRNVCKREIQRKEFCGDGKLNNWNSEKA